MKKFLSALLVFLLAMSRLCAQNVVISEIFTGPGSINPYDHEFIELYNSTSADIDISGWSVQYANALASSWGATPLGSSATIKAHGYFLVEESALTGTSSLPTPDATGSLSMIPGRGKIALVNSTTLLSGTNPSSDPSVVDFVGYGDNASGYRGTGPVLFSVGTTVSMERKAQSTSTAASMEPGGADNLMGNGYYSNDNSQDFVIQTAINPQNASSPIEILIPSPATQATAVTFTNTTTSATTVSWTNGDGASRAVFMAATSTGTPSPVNLTAYAANAAFGSGDQIGASGWYCIYNGTGSSVNVSNLIPGTTYQVMIVEYNGTGSSVAYLTSTGTGNPASITTVGSPPGNALATVSAGNNQYVKINNTAVGNFGTGDFTAELWMRTLNSSTGSVLIYKRADCNNWAPEWGMSLGADGKISILEDGAAFEGDASRHLGLTTTRSYNDGHWHHVAMVRQGTALTFYVDGILVASGTLPASNISADNGAPVEIGHLTCNVNPALNFEGNIDEVRLYTAALTQANILADMTSTTVSVPGSLQTYYNFDQNNATTITDQSGNGNNGTLMNGATFTESYAMVVPGPLAASGVGSSNFTANWTAPAIGTVTNYILDVSTDSTFTSPITGSPFTIASSSTSQAITGLNQNTTYYYRVRADKTSVTGEGAYTATITTQTTVPTPAITSFTPASGAIGTVVTITGTGLNNPTAFSIGGKTAIVVSNTGTSLVAMVMPGATTGNISLTTTGGTGTSGSNFTVTSTLHPNIQQGNKLTVSGTTSFGNSVVVSADGNTAIVGSPGDNSLAGGAYVFVKSGGVWTQQGSKLFGTGAVGSAQQGAGAVALSADGNTAMIGGLSDNSQVGAVWVFTRSGNTWTQQGNKLVGTGNTNAAFQGLGLTLSADGNTAVVGGMRDNSFAGAIWVYTRSGSVWTQQGNKITPSDATGTGQFGNSVSLSADGNTLLVGGNAGSGAAWIFTRSGNAFTQLGNKLTPSDAIGNAGFGNCVNLNADGTMAAIGGWNDNSNQGAVWIFKLSGGTWSQQGNKLVGTGGATGIALQGQSLAMSADGNTVVVGGGYDSNNIGSVWIYTNNGTAWVQKGSKLVGTDGTGPFIGTTQGQGTSVALTSDGSTLFSGAPDDNSSTGAFWTFISSPSNADLSALTTTAGTISPTFAATTTAYTVSVANTITSVTITPTVLSSTASVQVRINTGTYNTVTSGDTSLALALNSGANTIDTKVTAEDGSTKTYTITVTRAAPVAATNIIFTNLATTSATISWTNGNGDSRVVFMEAGPTGSPSPVNAATYTANTVFGSGTTAGTGWYCVYNGAGGAPVAVTGLAAGTVYKVMVIEYTGSAATTVYQTSAGTNNPATVTTIGGVMAASGTLAALNTISGTPSSTTTFSVSGTTMQSDILVTPPGGFEVSLDGLAFSSTVTVPNVSGTIDATTVYVRLAAADTANTYSGNIALTSIGAASEVDVPTVSSVVYALPPATQASNIGFTNVASTSLTLNWTNGNGTGRAVFIEAGSSGLPTIANGTNYNGNTVFGSGTTAGTGWYCVYNGTSNTVNVTSLTASTIYTVAVIEYNGSGVTSGFQAATVSGNPATIGNAPVISSLSYTNANDVSGGNLVNLPVAGGGTVTLTGSGFIPGMTISTGETLAVASSTSATYTLAANTAGTVLTPAVTTASGTSTAGPTLTYAQPFNIVQIKYNGLQTVGNMLSDIPAAGGGTVVITGLNFIPGMTLSTGESVTVTSATSITYTLASGTANSAVTATLSSDGGSATIPVSYVGDHNYVVTNTAHAGLGSLPDAVTRANASDGTGFNITFNIAGDFFDSVYPQVGGWNFELEGTTLTINKKVTIDGTTQPGYTGTPILWLNGYTPVDPNPPIGINPPTGGITLNASNSVIKGIAMTGFDANRFVITGNNNTITNCYIGSTPSGTIYGRNAGGPVTLNAGASGNLIGGSTAADRNVLSGVFLSGAGSGNVIKGNYIGTNIAGTNVLSPGDRISNGNLQALTLIDIAGSTPDVIVGGNNTGEGNLIAGGASNIEINSTASAFTAKIQGNIIGLTANGTAAIGAGTAGIPYTGVGIFVAAFSTSSFNVLIGSDNDGVNDANERNIISGNTTGIIINSVPNVNISGNYIGTDITGTTGIPNTSDGITLNSNGVGVPASGATIFKNIIGYNGSNGITLASTAGTGNKISQNSIHNNTGLGIDLNADGPTVNDAGDVDSGPNNLINFPFITSVITLNGSTTITGTLDMTAAAATYTVELFSNTTGSTSGYGEGQTYLGNVAVTTNASGHGTFSATYSGALTNVSATATDASNNTSEFSHLPVSVISSGGTLAALSTTSGTPSSSTSFTVSGVNMTAGVTVTAPTGFEVSTDNSSFSSSVSVGAAGAFDATTVYIRLAAADAANTYSNNIVLTSTGATEVDVPMVSSTVYTPTTITNVTSTTANGAYKAGTNISIQVVYTATVDVTGTPTLLLSSGGTASYTSGTGTDTLTFTYTVGANENTADLDYSGTTALSGTIKDHSNGLAAILTLPSPAATGSLGANKNIVIDTQVPAAPTITDVYPDDDTGTSNTDKTTKVNTPRIDGQGDPNINVNLYDTDGTTLIGTAGTNNGGSWQVLISSALSDGQHTLTAKSVDAAGNYSPASSQFNVIIDTQAPTISSVAIVSDNAGTAKAKAGDQVTLSFTTNETVTTPTVTIDGKPATVSNPSGNNYSATYTFVPSDTQGIIPFTISTTDPAGNNTTKTTTDDASSILFDSTAPTLTGVSIASNNSNTALAKTGDVVTISFTASEAIGTPAVTIAGHPAIVSNTTGNNWTATYTTQNGDAEGTITFNINFADLTGNAGTTVSATTNSSLVTFDSTAPVLTLIAMASNNTNPAQAKTGDIVTLNFTSSEGIGTPAVTIAGHSTTATNSLGNNWTASYTMLSSDSEGAIPFSIGFSDQAGNAATPVTATTNSSSVTFDKTAPTLTTAAIASNNSNTSEAKTGDIVTLNFTSSESIGTPTVTVAAHSITATNSTGNNWTASYTMLPGDSEGVVPFSIDYSDQAGNVGTQITSTTNSSSVTFDKTAPMLTPVTIASNNTNPAQAKTGDLITLNFTASESIGTPTVTIATHIVTATNSSSNNWTASYTMLSGDNEGVIPFSINFSDQAGNGGTQITATTNSSSVTFDKTTPTLSPVTIASNNANPILAKTGDLITLNFTASESIGTPTVTIATHSVTATNSTGNNWTASYTMVSGDSQGVIPFSVGFSDQASNAGTQVTTTSNSSSVTFDSIIPTVAGVSVPANATYITAQNLDFTVNFSEAVTVNSGSGTPQIAMTLNTGGTVQAAYFSGSGSSALLFRYTVAAGNSDPDGISVGALTLNGGTLQDAAGNNAALALNTVGSTTSVLVDAIAPTVSSINRVTDSNPNNNTSDHFTVTFSEDVMGVDAGDFTATTVAGNVASTSISVTPVSASVYTVVVNGVTGDGTLRLDLNSSGTGITDLPGNAISGGFTSGQTYMIDHTVPTLGPVTIASNNTNPAQAKIGDLITLNFTASESIVTPTITIAGHSVTATNASDNNWTANYTMLSGDSEGIIPFSINFSDQAGNAGIQVVATTNSSSVTFDKTAPTLSLVTMASNNTNPVQAKIGDIVTLNFTSGESVGTPTVTIATHTITATNSGNNWTANYTMLSGDSEGIIPFSINFSDQAGNAGTQATTTTNSSSVTFDRTAPTLAQIMIASNNTNPALAKVGDIVTLNFTASESIGTPAITIAGHSITATNSSGNNWVASYTMLSGDSEDIIPFSINFSDQSGNTGAQITATTNSSNVTFDKTAPTLTPVTIASNNTNTTLAKTGDLVTLNFTASESIGTPAITIAGHGITATNSSGNNWVASYTMLSGDSEGIIPFNINFSDQAGNAGTPITVTTNSSSVTFDKTAPAPPVVVAVANGATVIVATPAISGTAEANSTLTVYMDGVTVNPAVAVDGSGNWSYTSAALSNADHTVKATAKDAAGNVSGDSNINTFTVNVNPTITATGTLNALATIYGTASSTTQFTVSATNLTAVILVTPANGFEVSTDNTTFSPTVTVGSAGNTTGTVYVRLKSDDAASTYSGNITLTSPGANTATIATALSTVNAKNITIAADAKTKTYGQSDPALTYQVTTGTLVGTDGFTGSLTRATGENAGDYAITQGTLALSSNYTLTYTGSNLAIGKAALTITANNQSKGYGFANPPLTVSYNGFVNGDDNTSLSVQPTITTTATTNSAIGTYPITPASAASTNYNIAYVNGTLTISNAILTITANNQTKVYGSANPALTLSYSGFLNGDDNTSLSAQPSISTMATTGSPTGSYPVIISGAVSSNYTIVYVPGILTVTKAPLTVTADNQSRNYGTANPPLTVSYSGFVNGDGQGSLTTPATATTTATTTTAPGNKAIMVDGASAVNYTFNYVAGNLTIVPLTNATMANLTVSSGKLSPAFNTAVLSYTDTVAFDVNYFTVTPTYDVTASATIAGSPVPNGSPSYEISLNTGDNIITTTITAQDGVTQKSYSLKIYKSLPPVALAPTNLMSPNGDGKNDSWVIKDIQLYANNTVTIYDRAGRVIYTKHGYNNDWNGTLNGAPLSQGTYFYVVDLGPDLPKIKGYITILKSK